MEPTNTPQKRQIVENWHTGEAQLWIANDEPLYCAALRCKGARRPYGRFLAIVGNDTVPGYNWRWTDKRIQRTLMNEFIRSLE